MKKKRRSARWICFLPSLALFVLCLGEALVRWDAMAGPVRIIIRLIGYGKLSLREIADAVLPDLDSLLYPLWVLAGAVCALLCMAACLPRRRGLFAGLLSLLTGAGTLLYSGGTALHALRTARGCALLSLGLLFLARGFFARPGRGGRRRETEAEKEDMKDGREGGRFSAEEKHGAGNNNMKAFPSPGEAEGRERLFAPAKRRPLFGGEKERGPLFDARRGGGRKER